MISEKNDGFTFGEHILCLIGSIVGVFIGARFGFFGALVGFFLGPVVFLIIGFKDLMMGVLKVAVVLSVMYIIFMAIFLGF